MGRTGGEPLVHAVNQQAGRIEGVDSSPGPGETLDGPGSRGRTPLLVGEKLLAGGGDEFAGGVACLRAAAEFHYGEQGSE